MKEYTNGNGGIIRFHFRFPETDPQSLAGYQELLGFMFEATIPEDARHVPFRAEAETYVFDGVLASRADTSPTRLNRPQSLIARMASDDIAIVAYTKGDCRVTVGGVPQHIKAGEILILDLARPTEIETSDMQNSSLLISRQRLQAWSDVLMDIHGTIIRHGTMQRLFSGFIQSLVTEAPNMHESESAQVAEMTLQFVGSILQQLRPRQIEAGSGAVQLSRMRAFIEGQLANRELGPQTLMQEFGVSRPTLYRQFEPLGGVIRYITERRLQTAFRIVTDPANAPPRISQLAYDFGFSSASAFGRAFREMFGLTPSEARNLAWRKVPDSKAPPALASILDRFAVVG